MAILMPQDTRSVLGPDAKGCESGALLLDRFSDPKAKEEDRRNWFSTAIARSATPHRTQWWNQFVLTLFTARGARVLYAQLNSRLLVNMAGGVMENAGLCLDRFGMPWIPGAAIKGCARRTALGALHEWCLDGQRPMTADNPLTPACEGFDSPVDMLAAVARVFGLCEQDGSIDRDKQGNLRSDLVWAGGDTAPSMLAEVARRLGSRRALDPAQADTGDDPWDRLANRSGTVAFLPSQPLDLHGLQPPAKLPLPMPPLGSLELDVVTCHHGKYYRGDAGFEGAPDTEEPVPLVFSAVTPGQVFIFVLEPLRSPAPSDLDLAQRWLALGLSTFGIGAKTNAGYGWFQDVTAACLSAFERHEQQLAEADKERDRLAQVESARGMLTPDLPLLERLRQMSEADLRGQVNAYATDERFWTQPDERLQYTILQFLLTEPPAFLEKDRTNPKSKVAKAITHLLSRFPKARGVSV